MQYKGDMIEQYLITLHKVISESLSAYRRICAIRFDLHFPINMYAGSEAISNEVMSRFIESIKAKIRHDRNRAKLRNPYAHDTDVRYIWTREQGQDGRVHFHVALLLNREAYFGLGHFNSDLPNMYHRIKQAWASAIRIPLEHSNGLVHIPENPVYHFSRDTPEKTAEFFHRASYLCKVKTKHFGDGHHGFGASRH
jgi:hypothetical protein